MKVRIDSRINVEGTWWDITTEHDIDDDATPAKKVETIGFYIRGLLATGKITSQVPGPGDGNQVIFGGAQTVHEPEAGGAGFTWPTPLCRAHQTELTVSNVQKDELNVQFFCPLRGREGYCRCRAKVDKVTGVPTFWEVKK